MRARPIRRVALDAFPFFDFPRRGHARRQGEEKANGVPGLTKLVILGVIPAEKTSFFTFISQKVGVCDPLDRWMASRILGSPVSQSWRNDFAELVKRFVGLVKFFRQSCETSSSHSSQKRDSSQKREWSLIDGLPATADVARARRPPGADVSSRPTGTASRRSPGAWAGAGPPGGRSRRGAARPRPPGSWPPDRHPPGRGG